MRVFVAPGERGRPPRHALRDATSFTPDPPRSGDKAIMIFDVCEPCLFSHASASGISPGRAPTRRRARSRRMAGAEHRRQRLFARRPVGLGRGERADPRAARRSAARPPRRRPRPISRASARILLVDPGGAQRLRRPAARHSRAGSARPRGPRRRRGRRHSRAPAMRSTSALDGRRAGPAPAPLAQLAAEIGGELRAGRRIAPGIGKRGLLERPPRSSGGLTFLS